MMIESKHKFYFGMYICTIVAGIQLFAWHFGHNGQVFALTSLVIGGIVGAIFGLGTDFARKFSKKERIIDIKPAKFGEKWEK